MRCETLLTLIGASILSPLALADGLTINKASVEGVKIDKIVVDSKPDTAKEDLAMAATAYKAAGRAADSCKDDPSNPPSGSATSGEIVIPDCVRSASTLTLLFKADGTLACRLPQVPDTSTLELYILTTPKLKYEVSVLLGPSNNALFRGAVETKTTSTSFVLATTYCWKNLGTIPAHQHVSQVTIRISESQTGSKNDTVIPLEHGYPINIGVAVLAGRGVASYAVANKTIQIDNTSVEVNYDAIFQVYPFTKTSFHRTFVRDAESFADWISICLGFAISNPTNSLFVGLGVEPVLGISIVGGWQPRRVAQLKPGFAVGIPDADSTVPTNTVWDTKSFAFGLSFDAQLAKSIVAAFK